MVVCMEPELILQEWDDGIRATTNNYRLCNYEHFLSTINGYVELKNEWIQKVTV